MSPADSALEGMARPLPEAPTGGQGQTFKDTHNVVLAAQTTQEREEFEAIKKSLAEGHSLSVLETICDATRRRQQEALMISQQAEAMIVVGGKTSGNTRRLADVAESCGIPVWHIEVPEELPFEALKQYGSIGLTAGASTPRSIIDAVQESLKAL
jgi:4-hydroxy-3-methylbut-2-enyl diphosphate reductase